MTLHDEQTLLALRDTLRAARRLLASLRPAYTEMHDDIGEMLFVVRDAVSEPDLDRIINERIVDRHGGER